MKQLCILGSRIYIVAHILYMIMMLKMVDINMILVMKLNMVAN